MYYPQAIGQPAPRKPDLGTDNTSMSFRRRLLLFFVIIVVVPMLAVALVLFSITADSENGKADAAIAQGLRSAASIFQNDRQVARRELTPVARDPKLADALQSGNRAAVGGRLQSLKRSHPQVLAIQAYGPDHRPLAAAGSPDAIAFAAATPSRRGRSLGLVLVSVTDAKAYAAQVRDLTGFDVRVLESRRVLASTIPGAADISRAQGNVTVAGHDYRARFRDFGDVAGAPLSVGLFEDRASVSSSIGQRRLIIGAILAAFLVLALLSSVVVVRALQGQVSQFLEAARRLARGDFAEPVPVDGNDEFAALGTEFNRMSRQLRTQIDEVERKRAELEETIRRVGEAFAAGLDREGIVKLTVRTAVEACEAEAGRALPLDTRKMRKVLVGESSSELSAALEAAERRAFAIGGDDDGLDWIAALEGGEDEPVDQSKPSVAEVGGVYALAAPLMARVGRGRSPEHVGVVTIARRGRPFDETEVELFAYLTAQAAVSIENADLHETVRLQAVTDELTGLYNLRHFHESLDGELERSRRFGTEVGLAMLDIDDFKVINDTYGHQQGDLVLIEVGRVLRDLSRDIDEPARYGGEEMAVILPQTDLHGAELLAERMRLAIEHLEIERLDGGGHLKVTASFGVGSLPECARDKASLIAEADAALYRAKRAGKNRVRHGEPVAAES
jgi:diguanylate cyclase (GGDEF)-like protein